MLSGMEHVQRAELVWEEALAKATLELNAQVRPRLPKTTSSPARLCPKLYLTVQAGVI